MWQGIAICLSLVGAEDVTVKPLHGAAVRGSVVAIANREVVLRTAAGEVKWELRALQSLKPAGVERAAPAADRIAPGVRVLLTDGTQLHAARCVTSDGKAVLEVPDAASLEMPVQVVRSLQFRDQDEGLRKQWNDLAEAGAAGDRLVVRKTTAKEGDAVQSAVVLDHLEGLVRAVTATSVAFEFDGDKLNVPLEKVEGILFHQARAAVWPDAVCRVLDVLGNEWRVQSLALENGSLQVQTVSGVRGVVPWNRVRELDFSSGNLEFLSDLNPESVTWRPYLVTPATPPALAKWFSLRRDQAHDGSALTLGGQSYDKGLAIHSRTLIAYRLTREYRRLQAVVGVDERFRGTANLKLQIDGDDRTLLTKDIRGSDPAFDVDLDIMGVRRIRILVDFGEDRSDAGDHLLLCNARLTK